jgi:hypothetical protein
MSKMKQIGVLELWLSSLGHWSAQEDSTTLHVAAPLYTNVHDDVNYIKVIRVI